MLFVLCNLTHFGYSQVSEKSGQTLGVSGALSITNKGISTIPSLTLGKPAAIFNLSVGNRLRFEPELRFSLEGKPWSFIFWWRYDMVKTENFHLKIEAHPAISFKTMPSVTVNGATRELVEARRFLAGELISGYSIAKDIDLGIYYLHAHGFDPSVPTNTDYVSLNTTISEISLFSDLILSLRPQFYYLTIDDLNGVYAASSFRLGKRNFPFSVSSVINRTINTKITGNPDLLWNISLNYSISF